MLAAGPGFPCCEATVTAQVTEFLALTQETCTGFLACNLVFSHPQLSSSGLCLLGCTCSGSRVTPDFIHASPRGLPAHPTSLSGPVPVYQRHSILSSFQFTCLLLFRHPHTKTSLLLNIPCYLGPQAAWSTQSSLPFLRHFPVPR